MNTVVIQNLISNINDSYQSAKKISIQYPKSCAGDIRTTLEEAVKLFWLKKYGEIPLWPNEEGMEKFSLFLAMEDAKFSSYFDEIIFSDMHTIRTKCNKVLHGNGILTVGIAQELLNRLEKCIDAIQSVIELKVIKKSCDMVYEDVEQNANALVDNKKANNIRTGTNLEIERAFFWNLLSQTLDENGNPFGFVSREHYAQINRTKLTTKICLCLEFVVRKKLLRLGIYIGNDTKTPHYNRLYSFKDEIEKKLGFSPLWNKNCDKNPDTRRIEIEFPLEPYDHNDYERVIEIALPYVTKYIDVFSLYLPEAFN